MKKKANAKMVAVIIAAASIAAAMTVLLLVLIFARGSEPSAPGLRAMLDRALQSSRLVRTAALYSGDFTLEEEVAVYSRGDGGIELSYMRKSLNKDLAADELYETTSFTASVTEADFAAAAILSFDESAAALSTADDGTVSMTVTDPAAFFGSEDAANYLGAVATVSFEYERPVSCRISYTLPSGHAAVVSYAFSY